MSCSVAISSSAYRHGVAQNLEHLCSSHGHRFYAILTRAKTVSSIRWANTPEDSVCKKANTCEDSAERRFNPCEDSVFVAGAS